MDTTPPPVVISNPVVIVQPAAPHRRGYTECLAAVDRGEFVYLCVGVYMTRTGDFFVAELSDDDGKPVKAGYYLCWLDPVKGRQMEPRDQKTLRPVPLEPSVGPSGPLR